MSTYKSPVISFPQHWNAMNNFCMREPGQSIVQLAKDILNIVHKITHKDEIELFHTKIKANLYVK